MEDKSITMNEYISRDVEKLRDTAFPVKSSLTRRKLMHSYPCTKLHPNPDDEFCDPAVGPSERIIREYVNKFRFPSSDSLFEPIQIVKIYPGGYMILNGHHRWAAFLRLGRTEIPVKLVNPTGRSEIKKMLKNIKNDRRVSIDLDEVVFGKPEDTLLEEPLPAPQSRIYKQRLRKGVPMLFNYLENHGYDVWLYSCKYYPRTYLVQYFLHYKVFIRSFITGLRRKSSLFSLIEEKYKGTLHIDAHSVVYVDRDTHEFHEYELDESREWAQAVIDVLKQMEENHV